MEHIMSIFKLDNVRVGIMGSDRRMHYYRNLCYCKYTGMPCSVVLTTEPEVSSESGSCMHHTHTERCAAAASMAGPGGGSDGRCFMSQVDLMYLLVKQCVFNKHVSNEEMLLAAELTAKCKAESTSLNVGESMMDTSEPPHCELHNVPAASVQVQAEEEKEKVGSDEASPFNPPMLASLVSAFTSKFSRGEDSGSGNASGGGGGNGADGGGENNNGGGTGGNGGGDDGSRIPEEEIIILPRVSNQMCQTRITGDIVQATTSSSQRKQQTCNKKSQAVAKTAHAIEQTEVQQKPKPITRGTQTLKPPKPKPNETPTQTPVIIQFSKGTQDEKIWGTHVETQTASLSEYRADANTQTTAVSQFLIDSNTQTTDVGKVERAESNTQTPILDQRSVCIQTELVDVTPGHIDPRLKEHYRNYLQPPASVTRATPQTVTVCGTLRRRKKLSMPERIRQRLLFRAPPRPSCLLCETAGFPSCHTICASTRTNMEPTSTMRWCH